MLFRLWLILGATFIFSVGLSGVEPVLAQTTTCSVRQIIKYVDKGYDRNEIRNRCQKADVPRCSLTQVIRKAENGATLRKIYKDCGRPSR